ncbi:type III-A CRISPR-associated protein Csm2 [Eisenibacter elegans]|uniref:type III-A CRISPR-associated protein Csm2 n=1 Tax=Eisenibacter elegans TaxID=997 RepID=UPI000421EC42|nr:type III-A CRISPR-associated protein Csm2 [Eisenibacter elegans]
MKGEKNHQKDSNSNPKGDFRTKTFAELAQEADNFFKNGLKSELLKFKQSDKIDAIFEKTEDFVEEYGKDVSTHQLRNIFQEIKKAKDVASLKLIRPNLAYIAGRLDNIKAKTFVAFLDSLIKEVKDETTLENFKDFMEAIVAYHKFYGSK